MRIDKIRAGQRHRYAMGDIAELAASLNDVGLLHPVVITPDRQLVAGARRLAAARSLGWEEVKVTVVDSLDDAAALLRAERDENTCRKAFEPTEEHSLYNALLRIEAAKAKERQGERTDLTSQKVSEKSEAPAKRAAAEAASGEPGRYKTLDKVGHVKDVAADETKPEPVRAAAKEALTAMDESGKVDGPYKAVKQAERVAEFIGEFAELEYYRDDPATVVRLGEALRGYDEPERSRRRDNLRRSIEADRRVGGNLVEAEPDHYLLAQDMFYAANAAARAIAQKGGADTFVAAIEAGADPVAVKNWEDQFAELASACRQIASACKPTLRRVK